MGSYDITSKLVPKKLILTESGGNVDFQQSQTYNNLLNALNIEQIVNTQYMLYSDQAKLEGYIQISEIYDAIARNEREHARIWMRQLNNGTLPLTEQNLKASAEYEATVGNQLYREYSRIATEEGFPAIAALFNGISNIELNHNLIFLSLYEDVIRQEVFCKPVTSLWLCMQCGNIMSGECAPAICPVCGFPQGYYRLYNPGGVY
jgi:rubrerythrin